MKVIIFLNVWRDNGILQCIKVRKNSNIKLKKGHILRNLSIISQKYDLQDGMISKTMEKDGLSKR